MLFVVFVNFFYLLCGP